MRFGWSCRIWDRSGDFGKYEFATMVRKGLPGNETVLTDLLEEIRQRTYG